MGLWVFSINRQLTHSSKVRCLVNNSSAFFFLHIVIRHNLERSFIPTLNKDKDSQIKVL